ncbi:MAG TPA: hypothetical protein VI756_04190, partial [Blastocatellia bacterium]
MEEGHIVVDSIEQIRIADVTRKLARESGFESVAELLQIARHGKGDNVYLVRFHYMPPGAVDPPRWAGEYEGYQYDRSPSGRALPLLTN